MKHAYCIIAHGAPNVLRALLSCIDDERNDIYLLIDKKSKCDEIRHMKVQKSKLTYVKEIAIYWGDVSQVEAELTLFEAASKVGGYGHVHLLSGVDMPLKSQDYIHHLCDDIYAEKNFIVISPENSSVVENARKRISYYYLFGKACRSSNYYKRGISQWLRNGLANVQKLFGLRRLLPARICGGSNWVSISFDFCDYLVSHKKFILKRYSCCSCPDEIYKQTEFLNSPFYSTAYAASDYRESNMRRIDWERGNPYVWKIEDLVDLKSSDAWFARKIEVTDNALVSALEELARS